MGGGAGTASPTQGAIMRDTGSVGRTDNSLSPLVRGTRSQGGGEGDWFPALVRQQGRSTPSVA